MTKGDLKASFEGEPKQRPFKTVDVRFLGSDSDMDFYLEGEDEDDRSIGFYFPDAHIKQGIHALAPKGDIWAYYAVRGSLTWETLEGSLDITLDMNDETVAISFKFSAGEGGGGTGVIKVRGAGVFTGRMPWTLTTRNLLTARRATKA